MHRRSFFAHLIGAATVGTAVAQADVQDGSPALPAPQPAFVAGSICCRACGYHMYTERTDRPDRMIATCSRCRKSYVCVFPPVTSAVPVPFREFPR